MARPIDELSSIKDAAKAAGLFDENIGSASRTVKELNKDFDSLGNAFTDLNKKLSGQELIQAKIVELGKIQSSIQNTIVEKKKALIVHDLTSYETESLKINQQQKILYYQQNALNAAISHGSLSVYQKKIAEEMADTLFVQNVALGGNSTALYDMLKTANSIDSTYENTLQKIKETIDGLQNQVNGQTKLKSILDSIDKILGFQIQEYFSIKGILTKILTTFTSIEDASFELRKSLGLIAEQGNRFKTLITDTYVKFANLGVTAETIGKTITGIANTFGSSVFATNQLVENFSILETSLGIASDVSAKVLKTFMGISNTSSRTQESIIYYAQSLAQAAQVPLPKVMEDIANSAENVRLTFRGTTLQLTKAAVEARRLGLSIGEVASVAEKLLDFQESINAEIEASVMMGKNLSFNEARVLAYRGDILGATNNILDTIEKTVDLNQVDYFTLKSIAAATGMSADKLQDTLQIRKDIQLLSKMGTDEARQQVAEYNRLKNMSEGISKNESQRALENLKNKNNLAIQKQIQTELNGLILQLGQLILPAVQFLGEFVSYLTKANNWLRENLGETGKWVAAIGLVTLGVISMTVKWGELFTLLVGKIPVIGKLLSSAGLLGGGGAAGATRTFGKGAMFAGIGSFLKSIGTGAGLMGAAASLYILAKSLKEFPTDLGGLSIGEYMRDMAGGLIYLGLAFGLLGLGFELIIPGAGVLVIMSAALVIFAGAMNETALAVKIFADSFAKLTENLNIDNLSKIKDGALAVKEAMSELRGELQNFNDKDLKVLENLGNLKANITAGVKPGTEESKKTESTSLAETIKSSIMEGMRQIKITVTLDGKAVGTGIASSMEFGQPAGAYTISTNQGAFK